MTKIRINGSETDAVRLFHLDLPREAIERFVTQAGTGEWPLKYGLGAKSLRPAFVDVVDLRDLGDMPLSRYLAEAHGATGDDFQAMIPQIDALNGHVIVLPAQAFDATSQDLTIATPLRWIGTFAEIKGKPRGARLKSAAAKGGFVASSSAPAATGTLLKLLAGAVIICLLLVLFLALR